MSYGPHANFQLEEVIHVRKCKATIDDVARVARVSRTTVSRVLNDTPGVSWPLRQRVWQAIAELGYRPNENARALASGRKDDTGLITVNFSLDLAFDARPYHSRAPAAAIAALETANVQLHIQVIAEKHATERIEAVVADATTGMVLVDVIPGLALCLYRQCRKP